jgi:hypothetical protein
VVCVYGGVWCVYGGVWWCVYGGVCMVCMVVYGGVCMVVCDRQPSVGNENLQQQPAGLSGSALIPCIRVWCVVRVIP